MGKEYVVHDAELECTMGTAPSNLVVLGHRKQFLRGQRRANIGDAVPFVNILPFGTCNITSPPKPCTPVCVAWIAGKSDSLVDNLPALIDSDIIVCTAGGGTITIEDSGQ